MSQWMKKLIEKHTEKCFYCESILKPESSFVINMNTSEGPMDFKICPECAKDFDEIMKELEKILEERI